MDRNVRGMLRSARAKRAYLVLFILFVLFFTFNDIIFPWYVNQGGIVNVPSVLGQSFDEAVKNLAAQGLEGRKGDVRMDKEHPAGIVIIQSPFAGDKVKKGRRVYLTVSGGEQVATVPNIKGRTLRDARFGLEREGRRRPVRA
ncbi:MAG: PASTA domain-containing protein [Ignavibacteria bacterium]|nr:MAG: PASTA domain-containing protein [Ignavibacteria bacterium]